MYGEKAVATVPICSVPLTVRPLVDWRSGVGFGFIPIAVTVVPAAMVALLSVPALRRSWSVPVEVIVELMIDPPASCQMAPAEVGMLRLPVSAPVMPKVLLVAPLVVMPETDAPLNVPPKVKMPP